MRSDQCALVYRSRGVEVELTRFGAPEIFNTNPGSQFTSMAFTAVLHSEKVLHNEKIAISMDGCGAGRDNVFVEGLLALGEYEEVSLRAHSSVSEARTSIGRYLTFYNGRRPHSSLDRRTPDHVYFNPSLLAAA